MNKKVLIIVLSIIFRINSYSFHEDLKKVHHYIQKKNYVQGISTLEKLLNNNPNDTDIYRTYAILLLEINNKQDALEKINKAILLSKKNSTNYMIAGNIYRSLNNYTNAAVAYEMAIKLDPGLALNYYEYAYLNLKQYKIKESERLLRLSQSFDTYAWQNSILDAKIAQYKGNIKKAQSIFFNIINLYPDEEKILDEFANLYLEEGQDQKALVIFKKANVLFENSIYRNEQIAMILFNNKLYNEALNYYKIIENMYNNIAFSGAANLQWKLYFLYSLTKNKDLALSSLKKSFELSPLNQFYISEYTHYLSKQIPPTSPDRNILAEYLEKLAKQERKKGISFYYLSLLQKVIELSPFNITARDKLLEYAKLTKNEFQINNLLKDIAHNSPPKNLITTILKLRTHLSKTGRLEQKKIPLYQYSNLIFIDHPTSNISQSISNEIKSLEYFIPNILSQFELQKPFEQESQFIFHNNTNYNIITHIIVNTHLSLYNVVVYDKKGASITNFKIPYSTEYFTEGLIQYISTLSNILPPIGYIKSRLPNSTFGISLGSNYNITNNSELVVLDKEATPMTSLLVTKSDFTTSFTKLKGEIPSIFFDFQDAYVIPIQYVPIFYTNQKNSTNLDINRIFQKKYN